jgi:probable phosphoglycerate mutase
MSGFTLYVARHGQTVMNAQNRYPGHGLTPLTALGEEQARTMGQILKRELGPRPALRFIASPLLRAQETMRLIRGELDLFPYGFATDAGLVDIDHGSWTGFTPEEMAARDLENYHAHMADKWDVPMRGGESYSHLAARVKLFLDKLTGDAVTVSHGATTQVLRGLLTGMAVHDIPNLEEPQGVVFRIRDGVCELLTL